MWVLPAGVCVLGDGRVKHEWPRDAHVPIPGVFVPLPHASILQGMAGGVETPQAEVGDLERGVRSCSDVCTVPVAQGAAIAASVR